MKKNIFVVSNDKFYVENNNIFNSNINTFTAINCFDQSKIYLVARKSKKKLKFKNSIKNIILLSPFDIFRKLKELKETKILIISLTPYNFFITILFLIMGINGKNMYLFLRSDGYQEYNIKFSFIGYLFYGLMLNILKRTLIIFSCSKSLTGISTKNYIFPSEITSVWLRNRKKQIKDIKSFSNIKILYVGRFRKEKGYESLLKLFRKLKINVRLTMIGNDYKYLKKNNYPKNSNLKIYGQIASRKKLIQSYNKCDIFILPSYSEQYPQVILESLSRLKPIIIFNDIKHLKKTFKYGLFNCERNTKSLENIIKKISKNYKKIQLNILKSKIYSEKNYKIEMKKLLEL